MNSVENFQGEFLGFAVDVTIDSDTPVPQDWDRLLAVQFKNGKSRRADFAFRLTVRTEFKDSGSAVRLPFLKKFRRVWWTPSGRQIAIENFAQILIIEPYKSAALRGPARWHFVSELVDSWLGWLVERNGLIRLHGLAVENRKQLSLLIAREGFGKTTLALNCIKKGMAVLGEEVVYMKSRFLLPVRMVLREKCTDGDYVGPFGNRRLHIIEPFSGRISSPSALFYGILTSKRAWPFAWKLRCKLDILIGLGLPQNLDLTLFPLSIASIRGWIHILLGRLSFVYQMRNMHCEPLLRSPEQTAMQTADNWFSMTDRMAK